MAIAKAIINHIFFLSNMCLYWISIFTFFISLRKEDFLNIANAICQLFPNKVMQSYYIPAENKHQSKGKLREVYNACRAKSWFNHQADKKKEQIHN